MAYFAEIENDSVKRVLVVPDEDEHRGQDFLAIDLGLGGTWVQTSYNGSIRKNYAGIGMEYHSDIDAFVFPKPFDYWVLDPIEARYFPPEWESGIAYLEDYIVQYNGTDYQVNTGQGHTSQADWTPDIAVSLFKKYDRLDQGNIPNWRQPLGSHDAYPMDYIVENNDKFWKSNHEANVWQPPTNDLWIEVEWNSTLFQWEEVVLAEPEISQWIQPTGGHDAYNTGDKVLHNGDTWESTLDANVWEPGVYGWIQI